MWVGFIQSEALVIALLCLAATGSAAFMVNYFAFGQDVAPSHTGLVIGCLGGLGNLFAAGFMPVAGWISQGRSGFTPNFIIIGLLPLAGLAALLAFCARTTQNQPGRIVSLLASFPFNPSDFPFPGRLPGAWDPSGYEPTTGPVSSPS